MCLVAWHAPRYCFVESVQRRAGWIRRSHLDKGVHPAGFGLAGDADALLDQGQAMSEQFDDKSSFHRGFLKAGAGLEGWQQ